MVVKMSQPTVVDRDREAAVAVVLAEAMLDRPVQEAVGMATAIDFYLRAEARAARAAVLDRLMRDAASCGVVRIPGLTACTFQVGCFGFDPSTGLGCGSFRQGEFDSPCPRHSCGYGFGLADGASR